MARMSLIEHLTELRDRLIKAAVALTVFSVVGFLLSNRLLHWLVERIATSRRARAARSSCSIRSRASPPA